MTECNPTQNSGHAEHPDADPLALDFRVQGQGHTVGHGRLVTLSEPMRARRARRAAGVCIAIGLASIFVPIVHFVAPWFMLIVATLVYRSVMRQGAEVHDVSGPCPGCGKPLGLPVQPANWPLEWNCPGCRKRVAIAPHVASDVSTAATGRPQE
jgi:hypothetical protein